MTNPTDLAAVVARDKIRKLAVMVASATEVGGIENLTDILEEIISEATGDLLETAHRYMDEKNTTQSDLAALRAEKDQWHSTASRLHDEATELGSVIDGLRAENERLRASRELHREAHRQNAETFDRLNAELTSLRSQLAAAQAELQEARRDAEMACVEPNPKCDCSGCQTAAEFAARTTQPEKSDE